MRGRLIAIIGGTCSGKTTIAKKYEKEMKNAVYVNMEAGHGARLVNPAKVNKIKEGIKSKTINSILYKIGRIVYGADVLFRMYFVVLPLTRRGKTVICDRYYDIKWVEKFLPTPNLTILIRPDIKILKKRKRPEVSMKQVLTEREEADNLFKRLKHDRYTQD